MDDLFTNKCKSFVEFMLVQQQWSGITKREIDKWLSNFQGLTTDELKTVYTLLTKIIYFSEKDVTDVLKEGVFNCVAYDEILNAQKNSGFNLSQRALRNIYERELRTSYFVPLLDSNSPHESGNYVSRLLVQQGIIPSDRSMFIDMVPIALQQNEIKRLIIVDDCVGSGQQLTDFWECRKVRDGADVISIKELCGKHGISANYLTLFGYDQSIESLKNNFKDLNIFCARYLRDQHRVFSDSSYMWESQEARNKARDLFGALAKEAGIPLLGYRNLDFAFIMHQTIPDWSLPLFWKENADWNLLVRRKNSND